VFHGMADLVFRRSLELPIRHKLDAKHEACPPHVADDYKSKKIKSIHRLNLSKFYFRVARWPRSYACTYCRASPGDRGGGL
jgi:hypothetical protein